MSSHILSSILGEELGESTLALRYIPKYINKITLLSHNLYYLP